MIVNLHNTTYICTRVQTKSGKRTALVYTLECANHICTVHTHHTVSHIVFQSSGAIIRMHEIFTITRKRAGVCEQSSMSMYYYV